MREGIPGRVNIQPAQSRDDQELKHGVGGGSWGEESPGPTVKSLVCQARGFGFYSVDGEDLTEASSAWSLGK